MFTGIVEGLRTVTAVLDGDGYRRFGIDLGTSVGRAQIGASIAISGVCLTVERCEGSVAWFCAISETLRRTTLRSLRVGDRVNLEPSLRAGDDLGGHFVSGHVDGVAEVVDVASASGETRVTVQLPADLCSLVVKQGSITLDGVSLTVAAIAQNRVTVALIPHTLAVTTLGQLNVGDRVNVEMDTLGKWISKLMKERSP